jgi:hypothetical protein
METRPVIKLFSFPTRQGAEGNSRHSDRKACLLPGWAKELSAPLNMGVKYKHNKLTAQIMEETISTKKKNSKKIRLF